MSVDNSANKGDTKKVKQPSGAKHWCFTYHAPDDDYLPYFERYIEKLRISFHDRSTQGIKVTRFRCQVEKGELMGKIHLQGQVSFLNKTRETALAKSIFGEKGLNWFKKDKGSIYVSKTQTRVSDEMMWQCGYKSKPVEKVYKSDLSEENRKFVELFENVEPDHRSIHWIHDSEGNWGKTRVAKYLHDNFSCLYVGGSAKDVLYALGKYMEENDGGTPEYFVVDLTRTAEHKFNYSIIETLKNGIAFSGKYESMTLRFNRTHVIVMANFYPDTSALSADRWRIYEIRNGLLIYDF